MGLGTLIAIILGVILYLLGWFYIIRWFIRDNGEEWREYQNDDAPLLGLLSFALTVVAIVAFGMIYFVELIKWLNTIQVF